MLPPCAPSPGHVKKIRLPVPDAASQFFCERKKKPLKEGEKNVPACGRTARIFASVILCNSFMIPPRLLRVSLNYILRQGKTQAGKGLPSRPEQGIVHKIKVLSAHNFRRAENALDLIYIRGFCVGYLPGGLHERRVSGAGSPELPWQKVRRRLVLRLEEFQARKGHDKGNCREDEHHDAHGQV